jgi:glucose/arabinose dehydrogenase
MYTRFSTLGLVAAAAICAAPSASAQTPLTTELVADGFTGPVWAGSPPGDDRIFVVEKRGTIQIIDASGSVLPTPFLDINSLVGGFATGNDERGLYTMAFHPNFATNGKFFVYFYNNNNQTVARQYTLTSANVADASSGLTFFRVTQPFSNHNGGDLKFGPDGMLYLGTGDGGSANDPGCRAQNRLETLGKMLRFDVNNVVPTSSGNGNAAIPPTNPGVGDPTTDDLIWHTGLRNPWRWSFDRLTGEMYIADVGQNAREEVDVVPSNVGNLNFGWRVEEGTRNNGNGSCPAGTPAFGSSAYTRPVWEYTHSFGASISGGYVYRGCAIPDLQGEYFVADFLAGSSDIWSFSYTGTAVPFDNATQQRAAELDPPGSLGLGQIAAFGEDGAGEMLIVDYSGGEIFRIVPDGVAPAACPPLVSRFSRLSVSSGGTQYLELHAGASNAGSVYFMAGTTSGTFPGTPAGSLTLPINVDAYTLFLLQNPGALPLLNSIGVLDADGRAEARVRIAPGTLDVSFVGTTLHHAYIVLDGIGTVTLASNAAECVLEP